MRVHVSVSAALHRRWYLPGDVVRAEVFLESSSGDAPALRVAPGGSDEEAYIAYPAQPIHNHYNPDAAELTEGSGDKVAVVYILTAQAVGHCSIYDRKLDLMGARDNARKGLRGAADGNAGVTPREAATARGHTSQDRYTLFASPRWSVIENVALYRRQSVALALTLRLPRSLPSSHTGSVASFTYVLVLDAAWGAWGIGGESAANTATSRLQARCVVPIPVVDVTGAMLPLFLVSALASGRQDNDDDDDGAAPMQKPAMDDEYDFEARLLPIVPSAAIAAPTRSSLNPRQVGLRTSYTVRQDALAARTNQLALRCTPVKITLPLNGIDAMCITLQSSTVALGTALCGALTPLRGDDANRATGGTMEAQVVVKVDGILEQLECALPQYVSPGVPTVALPDVPHLVALHTHVVERQTWVPLDSRVMTFCFFLPILGSIAMSPTILSDVVTVLWQLRLRFWVTSLAALRATQKPGCEDLIVDPASPEVVLPLTVVPPRVPDRPRCGALCHSSSLL